MRPMADSDTHRPLLAYVVGAALGGIALALTAWAGLRRRRDDTAADGDGAPVAADGDLV